jgi:hypothetical protein
LPEIAVTRRVVAVSSADTGYFPLLRDMILSLDRQMTADPALPPIDLGIFDLGLTAEERHWLAPHTDRIVAPRPHFALGAGARPLDLAFLVRPFLPEYFPGFDIYLWIDSDVWLQSPDTVTAMIAGAQQKGMALVHESERAYRFQGWLFLWTAKHFVLGYGAVRGLRLLARPHLNAGIFAIHRDAPHWRAWAERYRAAIKRTGLLTPHDQFALNQAVYQDHLPTEFLPPRLNWICDRGVPMWNDATQGFCEPYPPYHKISALHLAGPAKRRSYRVRRTSGSEFEAMIRYGAGPDRALG